MVLSRRQPCRQKKQIEGCSKNTWNATKILKIQCALQRVILRCLDQSGHMGTFLFRCTPNRHTRWRGQWVLHEKRLEIARFPSVRSSMPACASSSRLSAQQVPCAWLAEHSDSAFVQCWLGLQSAQKGIAGASRVASASTPNSWRPGFASTLYAIARWHALVCRCWLVGRSVPCACVRV